MAPGFGESHSLESSLVIFPASVGRFRPMIFLSDSQQGLMRDMVHGPSAAPGLGAAASDARVGYRGRATIKRCHDRGPTAEQL
jgi:hypothetical protein